MAVAPLVLCLALAGRMDPSQFWHGHLIVVGQPFGTVHLLLSLDCGIAIPSILSSFLSSKPPIYIELPNLQVSNPAIQLALEPATSKPLVS